jgi:hypothetical protein
MLAPTREPLAPFSLTESTRQCRHPVRVMTLPVACGVVIMGLANEEDNT